MRIPLFDTASLYETERSLGCALKESGLAREDVIIETKLWIDEMVDAGKVGRLGLSNFLPHHLKNIPYKAFRKVRAEYPADKPAIPFTKRNHAYTEGFF